MVTQRQIIEVGARTDGAVRGLRNVGQQVAGLGSAVSRLALPVLGLGLVSGLLGVSLGSIVLGSAAAQNAMFRFRGVLEDL